MSDRETIERLNKAVKAHEAHEAKDPQEARDRAHAVRVARDGIYHAGGPRHVPAGKVKVRHPTGSHLGPTSITFDNSARKNGLEIVMPDLESDFRKLTIDARQMAEENARVPENQFSDDFRP